jgi:hypothetical protein
MTSKSKHTYACEEAEVGEIADLTIGDIYDIDPYYEEGFLEDPDVHHWLRQRFCKYCGAGNLKWHLTCTEPKEVWVLVDKSSGQAHCCIQRQRAYVGLDPNVNPNLKIWSAKKV